MNRVRVRELLSELWLELGDVPPVQLSRAPRPRRKGVRRPYRPETTPSDIDVAAARKAARKAGILP